MVQFSSDKSNKLQAFIVIASETACVIFSSHVEGFVISDQSRKWSSGGSHFVMLVPEQIPVLTFNGGRYEINATKPYFIKRFVMKKMVML